MRNALVPIRNTLCEVFQRICQCNESMVAHYGHLLITQIQTSRGECRRENECACRGHTYSLRPQQMVYTLPGRNYTEVDLNRIHEQALTDADASLLEDAWEVSSSNLQLQCNICYSNHSTAHSVLTAQTSASLGAVSASMQLFVVSYGPNMQCLANQFTMSVGIVCSYTMQQACLHCMPLVKHAMPCKSTAVLQMIHEDKELYSMTEMAELLIENKSPASCYALQLERLTADGS